MLQWRNDMQPSSSFCLIRLLYFPSSRQMPTNSRGDENYNECMKSGIWTNFTTGMKFSLKKE
jgi:hypothetical protein